MDIRRAIQRRIRFKRQNVDFLGDVNIAVSANVDERNAVSHVTSRQGVDAPTPAEGREERKS
jgi:hypothetical protein